VGRWYVGQIGMALGAPEFIEVLSDWTGVDSSSFTTTLFARTTGQRFVAAIGSNDNLSHAQTPPSSLVQTGITWTHVDDITRAGNTLTVYEGITTTSGASALTVNFPGTQLSMTWSIIRLTNTTGIVQSSVAQGQPSAPGWVDAGLAALGAGNFVLAASVASGSSPYPAARTGYSPLTQVAANSPNAKLQVHIGSVLPAGTQQPSGFLEDLLIAAVEIGV
jgi:hypothetical protein